MSFASRPLLRSLAQRAPRSQAAAPAQHCRSFAADAHGEVKVNAWQAPTEVSKWKEEHIVFAVLGSWALGITLAFKLFGGKKKEETKQAAPA